MWHKRIVRCLMPLLTALFPIVLFATVLAQDPTGRPEGVSPKRKRTTSKEKPKPAPEPVTVILTVISDPPMADVYIDGENRGATNAEGKLQLSKLPLGHHTIEVRKTGFVVATRFFNAGLESPTVVIRLTPAIEEVVSEFNSLVDSGKLANAREVLEGASAKFPDRPEVARMRATLTERLRERVAPAIPRTLNNWREINREEMIRALDAATQLASLNKGEARAQAQAAYFQGLITLRDWQTGMTSPEPSGAGNPEQASGLPGAKLDLERAVRLDETWAAAWYHLGVILLLSREGGAAEAAFVKCAQLDPRWAPAHAGLGAAYYLGMKYKEAIAAYQKALEIEPRSSKAHAGLGLARAAKGDVAAGVKDVQRAMDLDPGSALPHLNLGIINSLSKKDKDLKRAEEELRKAIQMNPQNIEFQNRVAEQVISDIQGRKKRK